jgi:hypothetical protein
VKLISKPNSTIWLSILLLIFLFTPSQPEASLLFHAAKRGIAGKIARRGFSKAHMNSNARFGSGAYFGKNLQTALAERPRAGSMTVFSKGKNFNKKVLDTSSLSKDRMKDISGLKDLRGTMKKNVIGPKLGHRLGRYAARNNKVIRYGSARYKNGTNYFIPKETYNPHGRLVRPVKGFDLH